MTMTPAGAPLRGIAPLSMKTPGEFFMSQPDPSPRLHRLLFRFTVGLTAILGLLLLGTPWLPFERPARSTLSLVLATFAGDVVVRRTSLAAGVGLLVTAFVFFRGPQHVPSASDSSPAISPRPASR